MNSISRRILHFAIHILVASEIKNFVYEDNDRNYCCVGLNSSYTRMGSTEVRKCQRNLQNILELHNAEILMSLASFLLCFRVYPFQERLRDHLH
jgi:hypothetical protein